MGICQFSYNDEKITKGHSPFYRGCLCFPELSYSGITKVEVECIYLFP